MTEPTDWEIADLQRRVSELEKKQNSREEFGCVVSAWFLIMVLWTFWGQWTSVVKLLDHLSSVMAK